MKQNLQKVLDGLATVKSLQHWVIKRGHDKLRLYFPKAHRRFAERYRQQIEDHLRYWNYIKVETQVILLPKADLT